MNDMSHLESILSDDLAAKPSFPVFKGCGLVKMSESDRQLQFRNLMRALAPSVAVFANANAGKRSRMQAKKEGVTAGVFDMTVAWRHGRTAYVEFKGFDKSGRAGTLSQAQIDWGNRMSRLGHDVAVFFDPMEAIDWVRGLGCPVREAR